jgi:hypothetical protein
MQQFVSLFNGPKSVAKSGRSNDAAKGVSSMARAKTNAGVPGVPTEPGKGAGAKSKRSDPIFMAEALERLLPHYDGNPHKVASRLDAQHREGEIRLLGGGVVMAPNANPVMLGIAAHIPSDGKASLYVQVRQALAGYYPVVGVATENPAESFSAERLERHHQFWTFERASFETHLPNASKNRGGGPKEKFVPSDLLIEALVYVGVVGRLPDAVEGEGSLFEKLGSRLGARCPGRTRFHEIFDPIYKRIKDERPR